jgi:ureidoacrylate peracid hydrolase
MKVNDYTIQPALLVIDVQNGFAAKGGSYDQLGIDISKYLNVIPMIANLISICRNARIPIFYTQAILELIC